MRPYHPSIKFSIVFVRVCVAVICVLLSYLALSDAIHDKETTTVVLGLSLFLAVMGAWHDGHALGEKKGRENGGALILILIAVALFAGLSTAVMRSNSVSGTVVSDQQARLAASEIIAYANTVRHAAQMMQINGASETEYDFSNHIYKYANENYATSPNGSCTTNACKFFHVEGGGIHPTIMPEVARIKGDGGGIKPGHADFRVIRIANIGTDAPDLVMIFFHLKKQICEKVNEVLGVENPSGASPEAPSDAMYSGYGGTITSFPTPTGDGLTHEAIQGRTMFCVQNHSGETGYFLYIVLLAR